MKNIIYSIAFIFLSNIVLSQDSASVLFIGNSYVYTNNLPLMLSNLTLSLGDEVSYASQTPGGYTLANHASNAATYTSINSNPWDYVVLQAQSQEPSFSDSQVDQETIPYAIQLADSVYSNNFCSEVMMFMTWGRENGDPQWGPISTFEGMNSRLRNAYMRMADSVQGSVSPVGSAWAYVRQNYPSINLYIADGSHPSSEGSYLAACTFYASIFRKSPVGASFIGTLDATTAGYLQSAAAITVLDSLEQWNLRPLSEHTQADFVVAINGFSTDFTNMSTKATNYYWDFGDGNTSTDVNPSHTYASNGTYTVNLIAESPCDTDTMEYQVTILVAGIKENQGDINVKYLGDGMYALHAISPLESIVVYDLSGARVGFKSVTSSELIVDLSENNFGIYLIYLRTEKGVVRERLPYLRN